MTNSWTLSIASIAIVESWRPDAVTGTDNSIGTETLIDTATGAPAVSAARKPGAPAVSLAAAVYLTPRQAAELIQVSEKTILRWSLEDALPARRPLLRTRRNRIPHRRRRAG